MTTVKDNLIAARALIDTPERWIKGESRIGDCFCALGAIGVVSGPGAEPGLWNGCHEALAHAVPNGDLYVARFNDDPDTTHADILALFDRAIAAQDGAA